MSAGPRCADAIAQTILAHGLDTVYGLPGIQSDWLFNAFFDLGTALRVVHTRHEQGAAYMALGAAMASGRPALYSVVPGPGFLNSTAALATAYAVGAPVVCLAGQIPSEAIGRGRGLLHEIPDQLAILKGLTKWAERVGSPDEGAAQLARAFQALRAGRPRPVGLELPPDILAAPGPFAPAAPLPVDPDQPVDEAALERAVALLAAARRPLIFVGGGALAAAAPLRRIAERLQAPVVANRMGRGLLDARHALSLAYPAAHRLWAACDVVLAIGTRLQAPLAEWGWDDGLTVIRIEIDAAEIGWAGAPELALRGDALPIIERLDAELARHLPAASRTAELQEIRAAAARDLAVLQPQLAYLQAIRDVLPEDGIFVEELTQLGYAARLAFPVYRPRTYLAPGYQGTLGWGFAAGLGAQDARRDVPVVAVAGDGGFLFTAPELATAVRHRIPLTTIVFNDGAFGNVRRMQEEQYGNRVIASDLANPDFLRLAESFGVKGVRAASPEALRRALEAAFADGAPSLIEVPCGRMPSPWPLIQLPRVRGPGARR